MVESLKGGISGISAVTPKIITPSGEISTNQNFGDFLKTDLKDFVSKSHQMEGLLNDYVQGFGNIEEIAPKFKELMLEFELKTKIVSSLAGMIKTLTSMQI